MSYLFRQLNILKLFSCSKMHIKRQLFHGHFIIHKYSQIPQFQKKATVNPEENAFILLETVEINRYTILINKNI